MELWVETPNFVRAEIRAKQTRKQPDQKIKTEENRVFISSWLSKK